MAEPSIFDQMASQVPQAIDSVAQVQGAKQTRQLRTQGLQAALSGNLSSGQQGLTAGAIASEQGQKANQAAGQKVQALGQIGEMALDQDATQRKATFQQRKNQIEVQTRAAVEQLRSVDESMAARFFDEQMTFEKDELGRTVWKEQQLMDYAMVKFKRDDEFESYKQNVTQLSQRRLQILKTSAAKIEQHLKQKFVENEQNADQEQRARLARAKADIERKIQEQAAENSERASMFSAAGMVLGAIGGIALTVATAGAGAPVGAAMIGMGATAGASLGSGGASALAGATANKSTVTSNPANVRPARTAPKRYN